MKEKSITKISLSTFLLIIAIVVIIVMGIFMYKLNSDKTAEIKKSTELQSEVNSLNGTVNDLQGKLRNISEIINPNGNDTNETKSNSFNETKDNTNNEGNIKKTLFSDLMNLLYIKDKTKGNGNNLFYKFLFDSCNYNSNFGNSNISAISILDKKITITDNNKNNKENTVNGINEEVVSVKIDAGDNGVRGIAF